VRCSRQRGGQLRGRGIEFWRGLEGVGAAGEPVAARSVALGKVYGRRDTTVAALRSVTLEFPAVEFTAVMGPSGSGKSTLLHCLAALDTPSSGKVFLGDTDISSLNHRERAELRRDRIGFVFQAFNLVPTLTARENITLPQLLAGRHPDRRWLAMVVEQVGLRDRLSHRPAELSGGQQQRVAVARALAGRPEIIFADEPTGNLDTRAGHEVLSLLRSAVDDHSQTIVMVTHDPMAASYADRVVFLGDGSVVDELREPTAERVLERLKSVSGAGDREPAPQPGRGAGGGSGRRPAPAPAMIPQRRRAQDAAGGPLQAAGRRWFSFRAAAGRGERDGGRVNGSVDDSKLPAPERPSRADRGGDERASTSSRAQAEARLLAQVRDLWDEPDERVLALVRAAVDDQFPDAARPAEDEVGQRLRTRPRRGEQPDEVIEHPATGPDDGWLEPLRPITSVNRSAASGRGPGLDPLNARDEPDRPPSAPVERAARGIPYRSARRDETVQWNPRDTLAPPPPTPDDAAPGSRSRGREGSERDRWPGNDPRPAPARRSAADRERRSLDEDVRAGSAASPGGEEPSGRLVRRARPSAREQATERFVQRRRASGDPGASPRPTPPPAPSDAAPRAVPAEEDLRERLAATARRPEAAEDHGPAGAGDDRGRRPEVEPHAASARAENTHPGRPQWNRAQGPTGRAPAGSPNGRPPGSSGSSAAAGREVRAYPARDAAERLLAQVRARASDLPAATPPRAAVPKGAPPPRPAAATGAPPARLAAASGAVVESHPAATSGVSGARVAAANRGDAGSRAAAGKREVASGRSDSTAGAGGRSGSGGGGDHRAAALEDDGFLPPVRGGDAPAADADTGDNRSLLTEREAGPSRSSRR